MAVKAKHAPAPTGREGRGGLLFTVAAICLAAAVFAAIPAARHAFSLVLHGNLSGLRTYIHGLGFGGLALLFALMIGHAVIPYPTEILTTTAGFIYGFLPGLALALLGWTCCAVVSYGIGRTIGRPLLRALLGKRFTRLEEAMDSGGTQLMLSARLIPVVPFALLGYVAGATRESLWKLVWTSFVGYLPLTAAVAYLGSEAKSLSVSNPLIWVAVVFVIGLLVGSHFWARRSGHSLTGRD
jgi:uncharacterized membrane protein YdjX (TVP38/TMEM64 family)